MNPTRPEGIGRWRKSSVLLMALALVLGACGGTESSDTTTASSGDATTTTAAGDTTTTTMAEPTDGPSGTLVVALSAEWQTLDPQMHRQRNSQLVARLMHDNLYSVDLSTNTWTPELAVSWEESGPASWDYKLREGVFFHNGEPFTAESVVATYERLASPGMNSPRLPMVQPFESIEIIDDYTVRFHMAQPYAHSLISQPGGGFGYSQEMLPPSMASLTTEEYAAGPVGTGPFKFVEHIPGQRLVLEANTDYWKGTPGVAELIVRPISEMATRAAELIAGSVHIIDGVDADTAEMLRGTPGVGILAVPGTAQHFIAMSMELPTSFRQALNHTLDRQLVVDSLYAGEASISTHPSFFGQQGYIDGYEPYPYDRDRAQELLAEAGGAPGPLEMLSTETNSRIAEAIAEQLRTGLGLSISVVTLDSAAFTAAMESGDFDLAYHTFGAATGTLLGAYYNRHFACATRDSGIVETGFCDPAIDEVAVQALTERDPAESQLLMQEMNRMIMIDPPWIPLWNPSALYGVRDEVKGFNPSPTVTHTWMYQVTLDN